MKYCGPLVIPHLLMNHITVESTAESVVQITKNNIIPFHDKKLHNFIEEENNFLNIKKWANTEIHRAM